MIIKNQNPSVPTGRLPLTREISSLGFSLIELLVVISIIAVLSAVLVANFMGARERARDAQKIQDLYSLKNALRLYYNDKQGYPGNDNYPTVLTASDIGPSYISSISDIGHTYYRTNYGDGFVLCVGLEAGAGNEDTDSQVKCGANSVGICGLGVGNTRDKIFAVCAN